VALQQPYSLACPCGSGLSKAKCCAVDLATLARPAAGSADPQRHLVPLEQQAVQARQSGDTEAATALAIDVLELAPGRSATLALLYDIRKQQGVTAAAEALIRRLAALDPNSFWATNEVCLLLLSRGSLAEAERYARNAVRIAPDNAQAHYLMGLVLTESSRPAFAEFHYLRALELSGSRDPAVLSNLALCLKHQGKMAEARSLYEESLVVAPAVLHTLLGFSRLEEADRNLDAALALLDRAEAVAPGNPSVKLQRAVVLGRKGDAAAALDLLARIEDGPHSLGAGEFLEKGRLLDKIGRYDEAFAAYDGGKAKLREATGMSYLDAQAAHAIGRLQGFFTRQRLASLPRAGVRRDVAQPIFILGFPRSGTTLMEQTLTAHPRIAAGDELPFVHEITQLMPRMLDSPLAYPEALAELWMADHREDLDNLRDHYLRKVAQLGIVPASADWFTDKMPLNETDLGLIALLFPRAPMIHVLRHPLDVVLSVYSNLLTHGSYCAYALETIARHYVRVAALVAQYRAEMDLNYLAVRYEDMVTDQSATVSAVLDFIGAGFDPACLDFHENRRYARTASYAQVSEKLYDKSRFRYRHYLAHLEPVIPILEPAMQQLGYSV
jgi:tetratricopeptide (TPR) repeat protein